MRNATTRSAILNFPTPLALVCVLFLILMHIQWLDLHCMLTGQCLFYMVLRFHRCSVYYSDGIYDLQFRTWTLNCTLIWFFSPLQWDDRGVIAVLLVSFLLKISLSHRMPLNTQMQHAWTKSSPVGKLERFGANSEKTHNGRNDVRCAETSNQKKSPGQFVRKQVTQRWHLGFNFSGDVSARARRRMGRARASKCSAPGEDE